MKREFSPVTLALLLICGCVFFRLLNNAFPDFVPNVSPLMAVAYVGAMYLPRKWGWAVGPVAFLVTDLAFLKINALTGGGGTMFSWLTVVLFVFFGVAGAFGAWIAQRKSLVRILAGTVACSLVFYVLTNTFSWAYDIAVGLTPGYPATLAGWWQANTIGLPGYAPTWVFLRNAMAGDLFFVMVLLFVLDRGWLLGQAPVRTATPRAV